MSAACPLVAGVDEAGRGPLAGPVVAAAVILDPQHPIPGLADSKKLSARRREILFDAIEARAHAHAVALATVEEIDALNIHHASLLAMQRAVAALSVVPTLVLVDGKTCPALPCAARAIIKGDATEPAISAASILAKVTRDRLMEALAAEWPMYGYVKHKGYPTAEHLAALACHGASPFHRRSFAPVAAVLAGESLSAGTHR
ncbi:MAG: ribonuclease HII [Gammaproteobacteria bacterium]|nr:ribonuclease HII [Gammaproteobacteria bacterium]